MKSCARDVGARDDTAEALVKRLAEYNEKTMAIVAHYAPTGVVSAVNGNQKADKVWADIDAIGM